MDGKVEKIISNGHLLETSVSTEAHKEYLDYLYKKSFYRISKYIDGKIIQIAKIKQKNLSELGIYEAMKYC